MSGSAVKNIPALHRRHRFNPRVGKIPLKKENGNPLQYTCLVNPMDRGTWRATVHGVAKTQTRLSDSSSSNNDTILMIFFVMESRVFLRAPCFDSGSRQ